MPSLESLLENAGVIVRKVFTAGMCNRSIWGRKDFGVGCVELMYRAVINLVWSMYVYMYYIYILYISPYIN